MCVMTDLLSRAGFDRWILGPVVRTLGCCRQGDMDDGPEEHRDERRVRLGIDPEDAEPSDGNSRAQRDQTARVPCTYLVFAELDVFWASELEQPSADEVVGQNDQHPRVR